MNALNQIANHLKIDANKITRCEEWEAVWFVVIQGKGARFVSKKVVKVEEKKAMEVKALMDAQTGKTVYGIMTSNGGCYNVYGTKKAAEKAMSKLTPWFLEYWGGSVTGSYIKSVATGRYQEINL